MAVTRYRTACSARIDSPDPVMPHAEVESRPVPGPAEEARLRPLLGFVAPRIAEEVSGVKAYHTERARQTTWLVDRLSPSRPSRRLLSKHLQGRAKSDTPGACPRLDPGQLAGGAELD